MYSTTFHTSPISIMKTSKRKIWSCHVYYDNKKKETKITFEKVNINKESKQESTQEIANHLSEKIITNPNQYLWGYDRFKHSK
uniref:Lipid A biosynthesis acyltransferase n=1 Tax=viral metagenome TaxID=1070528 RepID=A0A6C0EGV9_9ZZZZ